MDLWIKTYQNALKSQIDPKANWGNVWWKFSKLAKSKKILGELGVCGGGGDKGQIRGSLEL